MKSRMIFFLAMFAVVELLVFPAGAGPWAAGARCSHAWWPRPRQPLQRTTPWENPHKKFNVADALYVSNIITRK